MEMNAIAGLLACHVVRHPDGQRIVSYWANDGRRVAGWAAFATAARVPNTPASAGLISETHLPAVPLWRRVKPQAAVLSLVALFGAASALRDYLGVLVEDADLGIGFADSEPLDAIESDVMKTELRLLNRNRAATIAVAEIVPTLVLNGRPGKSTLLGATLDSLPALVPGQPSEIVVSGRAPEADSTDPGPDQYTLRTTFRLKAGFLRSAAERTGPSRQVRIWPRLATASPEPRGRCSDQCVFEGRVVVGTALPNGLTAQAVLRDPEHRTALTAVAIVGATFEPQEVEKVEAVSKVAWTTGPLRGLHNYHYRLFVASPDGRPLTPEQWRRLQFDVVMQ
jgi:hypothetical protein